MKVYWTYCCDYGHSWKIFRDENVAENLADTICPYGHEAVTLKQLAPADRVSVMLIPAAYMSKSSSIEVVMDTTFYIQIVDSSRDNTLTSDNSYSLDRCIELIRELQKLTWEQSIKIFQRYTVTN